MSAGDSDAGFSFWKIFGKAKGQKLSAAQKTKICDAIAHIAAVGTAVGKPKWNKMAAGLTTMKNEGRICFETHPHFGAGARGGATYAHIRIRRGKKKDRINITQLGMAQDVAFLASILVHEYAHACEPVNIFGGPKGNNKKAHCAVYFTPTLHKSL